MYYFDKKLLDLLNLVDQKYNVNYIFEILPKKITIYSRKNKKLWSMNRNFINLIMNVNLYKTNISFYDLFYLSGSEWRNYFKIGFPRSMIIKMIKSLIFDKDKISTFIYKDFGKKIDNMIL